jgi:perosamine synthetase
MSIEHSIPWAKPEFWGNESKYVLEALDSSWISGGPFVERLEADFCRCNDIAHAVVTSNGTTALHLAYIALGIRPGDEIIVPGYSFMAAANVALHVGAVPVFAEVDPRTWCITASDIERKLSPRTKAIVAVHTYGNVCEMDEINELAALKGLAVIEDAAEAFGSKYRNRMAGTMGTLGTYSMHATKTITTGEGGVAVTQNAELDATMRLYRSHGMSHTRYWHDVAGHNFRLTNMQAALGCAQLECFHQIREKRKSMFALYRRHLDRVPAAVMQQFMEGVDAVPWVVAAKLDPFAYPQGRDHVMREMDRAGIETRPGFYTPSQMRHLYSSGKLPVCDDVSKWVIALPSFASISEEQIETVCAQLGCMRH